MDSIIQAVKLLLYKYRNLILYGVIGSISASLDFAIYLLLEWSGLYYLVANICSVSVGIVVSFMLNRHYNFRVKDRVLQRFVSFIVVGLIGLVASSVLLYLFVGQTGLNDALSKLLSIIVVVMGQFVANKYITFKTSK